MRSISRLRILAALGPATALAVAIASCGGGGDSGGGGNQLPAKVAGLSPASGATEVATDVTLSWAAASNAGQYFVYLGTTSPLTIDDLVGGPTGTSLAVSALQADTTYYWRVDAANAFGTATGDEASFTTASGAPAKVANPSPADGSTGVALDASLGWSASAGAVTYSIYFGTQPDPVDSRGTQLGTSLALETLAPSTTYYWRVDAENQNGTTAGDVWSFTTRVDTRVMETEPNDTAGTADALPFGRAGAGDVFGTGDIDFWSVELAAGSVYSIELRGIAASQSLWDLNGNRPTLELRDTNGVDRLLDHLQPLSNGAPFRMDQDMPAFTVPADGTYYVVIHRATPASQGGSYIVRVKRTSTFAVQQEQESAADHTTTGMNDSIATAQPIELGMVRGFHVDDEDDYYRISVPQSAGIVQLELVAWRNGRARGDTVQYDPHMSLHDGAGNLLRSNDDEFGYDPAIDFPFDGTPFNEGDPPFELFVRVGECCGGGDSDYLLKYSFLNGDDAAFEEESNDTAFNPNPIAYGQVVVGGLEQPNTVDWWSFQGTEGDMVDIRPLDASISDPGTGFTENVTVELFNLSAPALPLPVQIAPFTSGGRPRLRTILGATTTYGIRVTSMPGSFDAGYGLVLESPMQAAFEAETFGADTNNDNFDAEPLPASGRVAGFISHPGDVDVFRFNASAGEVIEFALYCGNESTNSIHFGDNDFGSALTGVLDAQSIGGTPFGRTENNGASTGENLTTRRAACSLIFTAGDPGIYTVRVEDFAGGGSGAHHYLLERR